MVGAQRKRGLRRVAGGAVIPGRDLPSDGVPLSALRRDAPRSPVVTVVDPGARATRVRLLAPRIVADYRDGVRVAAIVAEHGLAGRELYALLRACGVPLRHAADDWRRRMDRTPMGRP